MKTHEKNIGGTVVAVKSGGPTAHELSLISEHARKELSAEEVYTFPVNLCDNEIDRDKERFTKASLKKLAELFVGKTGIFDHSGRSRDQVMRVYSASVVTDNEKTTSHGEPYAALRAMVYMLRLDKNANLIAEIEAGIKKEVSVACAVGKVTCSICGKPYYSRECEHRVGMAYDGGVCARLLEEPTDAYEFSFVAVPAQPGAGVTKSCDKNSHNEEAIMTEKELREKHPELLCALEQAAEERGKLAARKEMADAVDKALLGERARLKSIEEIAVTIGDEALVKAAMYGDEPLTAEQLCYAAARKNAALGADVLGQMEKAAAGSKANDVGGAAQPGEEPPAKKGFDEERAKQMSADLGEMKGESDDA